MEMSSYANIASKVPDERILQCLWSGNYIKITKPSIIVLAGGHGMPPRKSKSLSAQSVNTSAVS